MKLFIDNTQTGVIKLAIGEFSKETQYSSSRDQDLLKSINDLIIEKKLHLSDITEIEVVTGPGGFTSLRTSIAIAQSLAFALSIPINSKPSGTTVEALYGKEPNISIPRKQ